MTAFNSRLLSIFILVGCLLTPVFVFSQPFRPSWSPSALDEVESFSSEQKLVGTHYFYWYDYPHQHFFDDGAQTDDALEDHFVEPEAVSFNSSDWHKKQLADCTKANIDFIMPVYWGAPGNYFQPGIIFSVQGLGPLQRAIQERSMNDQPSPKVAMFYDTSTLLPNVRGEVNRNEKYDLRKAGGKEIFYQTIRDFFYQIHPRHWAAIDGRPVVVLYGSGFAAYHDQSTFDFVYDQFQEDFHGLRPFIIRDHSWNAKTEAVTSWGAALGGPKIFDRVAQIGPGYNDTPVPGRSTPIRERENGNFYKWSWNQVLDSDVQIVLLETWNEMHEGTSICHSKEYGKKYIVLSAEYSSRFKNNLPAREDITLRHPNPVPRPANDWGEEYSNQEQVSIAFQPKQNSQGIRIVRGQPDGPFNMLQVGEKQCVRSIDANVTYIYFDVADPFLFDAQTPVEIEYTYGMRGINPI